MEARELLRAPEDPLWAAIVAAGRHAGTAGGSDAVVRSGEAATAPVPVPPGTLAPFRSPVFAAMWTASVVTYPQQIQSVGATSLTTALAPAADMVVIFQAATVLFSLSVLKDGRSGSIA